ncbi:hypothetical protein GOP47_0016924 [Adiantum capillus-veneris]|uniref:Uncharacterized protein n=1 Tax=Adiantum capillus-veneris TaxID=13818 RepID=A0A9D4UJC7_ADICA|nr:hypothetical protein GOP47_0016924 [Adiantum capillus-veneris]
MDEDNQSVELNETQTEESANDNDTGFERLGEIIVQIWKELHEPRSEGNETFKSHVSNLIQSLRRSVDEYQLNVIDVQSVN